MSWINTVKPEKQEVPLTGATSGTAIFTPAAGVMINTSNHQCGDMFGNFVYVVPLITMNGSHRWGSWVDVRTISMTNATANSMVALTAEMKDYLTDPVRTITCYVDALTVKSSGLVP